MLFERPVPAPFSKYFDYNNLRQLTLLISVPRIKPLATPPTSSERNFCNFLSRRREMLPAMEFFDISLTKDSSLLHYDIHSPLKKTILVSKILTKNLRNTKTRVNSWIVFCRKENEGRKPDKNSSLRRLEFMPAETSTKMAFKNSISGQPGHSHLVGRSSSRNEVICCLMWRGLPPTCAWFHAPPPHHPPVGFIFMG